MGGKLMPHVLKCFPNALQSEPNAGPSFLLISLSFSSPLEPKHSSAQPSSATSTKRIHSRHASWQSNLLDRQMVLVIEKHTAYTTRDQRERERKRERCREREGREGDGRNTMHSRNFSLTVTFPGREVRRVKVCF